MSTILIYFVLFAFWLQNSLHFELEKALGLSMGMSFNNISIFALIVGWLFFIKMTKTFYSKNIVNINLLFFGALIFLLMFIETLSFVDLEQREQFEILKKQIVFFKNYINPWIYFFLISQIIHDKKTCLNAFIGVIALVFLTSMTGIIDQHTFINLGTQSASIAYEGRSAGFGEANQYAAFLVFLLPFVLSQTLFNKNTISKLLYGFTFISGFIGLISTVSRGGYIGFFFAIIAFFYYSIKHQLINITKVIIIFFIFTPFFTLITYYSVSSDVKDAFHYKVIDKADSEKFYNPWGREKTFLERYTSGRTSRWNESFQLFLKKPILGYGHHTISNILQISPHNDYLRVLIKYGIVGFVFFILIYTRIFFYFKHFLQDSSESASKQTYIGYLSGFIGYMVCMFGVGFTQPRYIFWIFTAITLKFSQLDQRVK